MPHLNYPQALSGLRKALAHGSARAVVLYLLVALLLLLGVVFGGREIEHHIKATELWIRGLGPWAPLAFVALFALMTSLFVPETLLCVIAGALFGLPLGFSVALAGGLVAGMVQFALSRELLRARIRRILESRPSLAAVERAVSRDELRLQLLLRLTPLNPATLNYLLGASGVRFSGFLLGCLALAPNLFVEVYFGHVGRHAARFAAADGQATHLRELVMVAGLAACIAVMWRVSSIARRAVMNAVAETDASNVRSEAGTP